MEEDIITFLENTNFDDFTKIRYIYIYVCDKFSYDTRFYYAGSGLKDQIYNKVIDIRNVQDYEIVCYSFARILVDLLFLFNINSEIVFESDKGFRHSYVIVKHQGKVLKLDPTKRHDITRVKMNSKTLDFTTLIDDPIFVDQLDDADKHIAEIENKNVDLTVFCNSETISMLNDFINESARARNIDNETLFFEKIDYLCCLINLRTDFTRYDDIDYYLSYLIKKIKINEEHIFVKPMIMFKNDDPTMRDIINIILVEYYNRIPEFYILEKIDKNYKMREIDYREVKEKMQEYSNFAKDYVIKRVLTDAIRKCR